MTPALGGIWKRPQLHPKLCLAGILTGGDVRKERFTQRTELRSVIDSWRHFYLVWGAKVSHWTSAEGELHQAVRQKKLQSGAFSTGPHAPPQVGGYLKNRKEERPNFFWCIFDGSKCCGKERGESPLLHLEVDLQGVSGLWSFIHAHNPFGSIFGKLLLFSALNCLNCFEFAAFKIFGKRHVETLTVKCVSGENKLHRFPDLVSSCKYWIWSPRK